MRILLGIILAGAAMAQSSAPAFDVASIRVGERGKESIHYSPGSVITSRTRITDLIKWAYRVQEYQINGPRWLDDERFDVSAKSATPAEEPELRRMLQSLLADRFKLTLHRETHELAALVVTVAKGGHKLRAPGQGDESFDTGKLTLTGKNASMSQMMDFLSRELRMPVVDQTGLAGQFDYTLDINRYVTEEMTKSNGPPPEAPQIIARAFQEQLGLKVESKKTPIEMLVIDHVEKGAHG